MVKISKEDMSQIAELFEQWNETLIWSCLQGYMGNVWADSTNHPKSAQIIVGDFCFFSGIPNKSLVENIPTDYYSDTILMIPRTNEWSKLIEEVYIHGYEKVLRYAIKKEPYIFNKEKLQEFIENIPAEYELKMIDQNLYHQAKKENWSMDLCSQFSSYEAYGKMGLGVMALHKGVPVSGASSYSVYHNGIEIEIDTKKEYRRKGLALACGAKLILECLERGLYPSWDAHDLRSVALAKKLGYHFDKEYVTYIIN